MNNKYKILIVDDNNDYVEVLDMILKSFGYESISVDNGEEAIDNLEKNEYDLIISDYLMEKMSGVEVLERVKKDFSQTKFLMVSGNSNLKDKEEAISKGADGYFIKGSDPQEIINKIEDFKKIKNIEDSNITQNKKPEN